ncbi:MAG: hypothetical protein ACLFUZ_05125 [Candidatus Micrarchaeia archaeon]
MSSPKADNVLRPRRKQGAPTPPKKRFPRKRNSSPPPLHPGDFGDSNPALTRKEKGDNAKDDYPRLSPWRIPPNNMP